MTIGTATPAGHRAGPDEPQPGERHPRMVLYLDFTCAWSYLASRRAAILQLSGGPAFDVRAVEHASRRPGDPTSDSLTRLRATTEQVAGHLLTGEELPYALAGFVPHTQAAVSGYAEAYGAGVASRVRHLLFEAFWLHAFDLGDPHLIRTLLVDAVRSGSSRSEALREWGYAVDVTGGPITTTGWRLVRQWRAEWTGLGVGAVPLLLIEDTAPLVGAAAVEWLGVELLARGVEDTPLPMVGSEPRGAVEVESLPWVSANGNRWMRAYQRAHRAPLFSRAG